MAAAGFEGIDHVLARRGPRLAVLFHGGHLRAELQFAQESFVDAGWSVLHVSRPGYGGTALAAGPDPARFVDRVAPLCRSLGFEVACAVGVSGGGPTAMTFAARHPDLVRALVLESAVSFAPWPDAWTRAGAHVFFHPAVEGLVWAGVRALLRAFPQLGLRAMMRPLSTLPVADVIAALSEADRARLVALFSSMRSSSGFRNDLRAVPDVTSEIHQPTLLLASRNDGAVPPEHSRGLARALPGSTLVLVDAESHLLWVGPHADQERDAVLEFLGAL